MQGDQEAKCPREGGKCRRSREELISGKEENRSILWQRECDVAPPFPWHPYNHPWLQDASSDRQRELRSHPFLYTLTHLKFKFTYLRWYFPDPRHLPVFFIHKVKARSPLWSLVGTPFGTLTCTFLQLFFQL